MMEKMDLGTDYAKEFENLRKRCLELEEKKKTDEMRFLMLETEVENLKKKNQELEGQMARIQKGVIVESTDVAIDDENLHELMVENKVLECEKRKAEKEVCFWKDKCKELECMNEKVNDGNCNEIPTVEGASGSRKCGDLARCQRSSKIDLQKSNLEHVVDEEDADDFTFYSSSTRSTKRKRAAKFIDDDDEDSYDDNAPICTLITQHSSRIMKNSEDKVKENVGRKRLTRLRKLESENGQDNSIIDLYKSFSSSEDEEDESESLGGFIVGSSDESGCDSESSDGAEDVVDKFKGTLERFGRKKGVNIKWDLEGDMLSDFANDPELCMRAVCALYRQQTDDEKECKITIHRNERGFSQPDSYRGCELAEFLLDGDPSGDLNKTVEELKEFDSEGIKDCQKFASKYSKQLFEIYQNKEDPYFLPK